MELVLLVMIQAEKIHFFAYVQTVSMDHIVNMIKHLFLLI